MEIHLVYSFNLDLDFNLKSGGLNSGLRTRSNDRVFRDRSGGDDEKQHLGNGGTFFPVREGNHKLINRGKRVETLRAR